MLVTNCPYHTAFEDVFFTSNIVQLLLVLWLARRVYTHTIQRNKPKLQKTNSDSSTKPLKVPQHSNRYLMRLKKNYPNVFPNH